MRTFRRVRADKRREKKLPGALLAIEMNFYQQDKRTFGLSTALYLASSLNSQQGRKRWKESDETQSSVAFRVLRALCNGCAERLRLTELSSALCAAAHKAKIARSTFAIP